MFVATVQEYLPNNRLGSINFYPYGLSILKLEGVQTTRWIDEVQYAVDTTDDPQYGLVLGTRGLLPSDIEESPLLGVQVYVLRKPIA